MKTINLLFFIGLICCYSNIYAQETLDKEFGNVGKLNVAFNDTWCAGEAACMQPDGKIIVGGWVGNNNHVGLVRLLSNGKFDNTFGKNGKVLIKLRMRSHYLSKVQIALQRNGDIVIAGDGIIKANEKMEVVNEKPQPIDTESSFISIDQSGILQDVPEGESIDILLVRLKKNGELDTKFGKNGIARINAYKDDALQTLLIDKKDNIYVAGLSEKLLEQKMEEGRTMFLAKADKNGKIDAAFGNQGLILFNDTRYIIGGNLAINKSKIAISSTAKIENNEHGQQLYVYQLDKNGKLDPAFAENGKYIFNQTELMPTDCPMRYVGKDLIIMANHKEYNDERTVIFLKLDKKGKPTMGEEQYRSIKHQYNNLIMNMYPSKDYLLIGGSGSDSKKENKFLILKTDYDGNLMTDFAENGAFVGGFEGEMNLGMHVFEDKNKNIYITGTTGWLDMKYAVMKVITTLNTSFNQELTLENTPTEKSNPNIILAYAYPISSQEIKIKMDINYDSKVTGNLYDIQGRAMSTKDFGSLNAGNHELELSTSSLTTGYYFIQLITNKEMKTIRIFVQH